MVDKLITSAVSLRNKIATIHQRVVEKYAPSFSKSGRIVTCFPLYDDKLTIKTAVDNNGTTYQSAKLVRCGKNLYNATVYPLESGISITASNGNTSPSNLFAATREFIPVSHLRGQTLTLNHPPIEASASTATGLMFYTEDKDAAQIAGSGTSGYTAVVPDTAVYMRFTTPKAYATDNASDCEIQIEIGSTITPLEKHSEAVIEKQFVDGISSGEITWTVGNKFLGPGLNNIYSDVGETTVSGRTDPEKTLRAANEFLGLD